MILQELIIINLSDSAIQRKYKFKEVGINLILGVKSQENDESNGVGKSDMVDSIRYVLGKKLPVQFNNATLKEKDIFFVLRVKLCSNEQIYLGRRIINSDKGYILKQNILSIDINEWECIPDNEYKEYVQNKIYEKSSSDLLPSFGSVMEYLIRDEKQGFNEISLPNRKAQDTYRILDFLCELPYNLEKEIKPLKEEQKEYNKQLAIIKSMDGEILELKIKEQRLDKEITKLSKIINNVDISKKFDVDEVKYKNNKQELNEIQREIFELEYISKQYKQNIIDLEEKVDKAKLVNGLEDFYNQAIGYFPKELIKNYEEMNVFYNFMLENRGAYFKEKIKDVESELMHLYKKKDDLKKVILQTSKILKNTELVDDINNLSEELTDKNKELAEIRMRIDTYDKKAEINKKINELKSKILLQNKENEEKFELYAQQKERLESIFSTLIDTAYSKEEGFLKFEYENKTTLQATTGRIKINCRIMDEKSHGRLYMKINLFDLTWFLSRVINNSDIQILVHDGSYCKPDAKVKEKVLAYVSKELNKYKRGQYFITANIDELTSETLDSLRDEDSIVAELNRENNDENRFFGFKYQNI